MGGRQPPNSKVRCFASGAGTNRFVWWKDHWSFAFQRRVGSFIWGIGSVMFGILLLVIFIHTALPPVLPNDLRLSMCDWVITFHWKAIISCKGMQSGRSRCTGGHRASRIRATPYLSMPCRGVRLSPNATACHKTERIQRGAGITIDW